MFQAQAELDYHDRGSLDPYEIEKLLTEFIEDSYISGKKYVLIITGKGRIVKPLVNKLLKQSKYVARFEQAGYFNGQSGAVEVTLI